MICNLYKTEDSIGSLSGKVLDVEKMVYKSLYLFSSYSWSSVEVCVCVEMLYSHFFLMLFILKEVHLYSV